jgi:FKBP-type peptidyl-prolyl cis-trans isomerase SlyD
MKGASMRIQIVSFHCVLKNALGEFISSSFNDEVIAAASSESEPQLQGLIDGLKGVKTGERKQICIPADQAYGFYRPELFCEIDRDLLTRGKKLKSGDEVRAKLAPDGVTRSYRVVSANPTGLELDANHPLAGQDLVFDIEIVSSREELDDFDSDDTDTEMRH